MNAPLLIAAAQPAHAPRDAQDALALLAEVLAQARGADLVVLPELALCGYGDPARIRRLAAPLHGEFIGAVRALVRTAGIGLIAGYAERDGERLYDAALALGPQGELLGSYRKVNLWGSYERDLFAVGSPSPVITLGALRLGLLICYDLEFPEAARDLALRGADTLIVISATGARYAVVPEHLVPARGYETGCHVVYANWTGVDGAFKYAGASCITGPDGAALARAPADGAALIRARIDAQAVAAWRAEHDYLTDRRHGVYRV